MKLYPLLTPTYNINIYATKPYIITQSSTCNQQEHNGYHPQRKQTTKFSFISVLFLYFINEQKMLHSRLLGGKTFSHRRNDLICIIFFFSSIKSNGCLRFVQITYIYMKCLDKKSFVILMLYTFAMHFPLLEIMWVTNCCVVFFFVIREEN